MNELAKELERLEARDKEELIAELTKKVEDLEDEIIWYKNEIEHLERRIEHLERRGL